MDECMLVDLRKAVRLQFFLKGRDEKKGREGRKERKRKEEKEKRGEKMERKGGESKKDRCIRPMGVKHPLRTVKRYKTHKTRRVEKKVLIKAGREEEETEMTGENMVTENRLRCENIGSVFYSSIKPGTFVNSIQVVRKGAII